VNRRRLIKSALAAIAAQLAPRITKRHAISPAICTMVYKTGWYVDAPVYTALYVVPNRRLLDDLIRHNPQLESWRLIPIGPQFLVEEPYESSLGRISKPGIDFRVEQALERKLAARAKGDQRAVDRYDAQIQRLLRNFPRDEIT
jgi:hypothetical protein